MVIATKPFPRLVEVHGILQTLRLYLVRISVRQAISLQ